MTSYKNFIVDIGFRIQKYSPPPAPNLSKIKPIPRQICKFLHFSIPRHIHNKRLTWQHLRLMRIVFMCKITLIGASIGVGTAVLAFRTKQYSTSHNSHICRGKQFCNDFFLNGNTIALVHNCLRNYSAVWLLKLLWTDEKESIILNGFLSLRKGTIQHQIVPFFMQ